MILSINHHDYFISYFSFTTQPNTLKLRGTQYSVLCWQNTCICLCEYWLLQITFIYLYRDVDNSRKLGKLPSFERDFSGCKALYFFLQIVFKCWQKIAIYLFCLFTPSLLSYLNWKDYIKTLHLVRWSHQFISHRPFRRLNGQRYLYLMYAK